MTDKEIPKKWLTEKAMNTTRDTEQVEVDTVNSPPHYNNGGMRYRDHIQQQLGGVSLIVIM